MPRLAPLTCFGLVAALLCARAPLRGESPVVQQGKPVSILINDLEAVDSDNLWSHQKSGPGLLMHELYEVFGMASYVQINCITLRDVTAALKAQGLPETLPRTFAPSSKTAETLKSQGIDIVLRWEYEHLQVGVFRVEAHIVDVGSGQTRGVATGTFDPEAVEPFQELAKNIKSQMYRALGIRPRQQHFKLIVCRFKPHPPEEKIPLPVEMSVAGKIGQLQLAGVDSVEGEVMECDSKPGDSELRLSGVVHIEKDAAGNSQIILYLKITHQQKGLSAFSEVQFAAKDLIRSVEQAVEQLGRDWQDHCFAWAEGEVATGPER